MLAKEMFEKMGRHLLEQGEKSEKSDNYGHTMCMYRNPNGLKCGIGALIPDKLYKPEFEGKTVQKLIELDYFGTRTLLKYILPEDEFFGDMDLELQMDFAMDLQDVHDMFEPDEWPEALMHTARWWNNRGQLGLDTGFVSDDIGS